MADTAERVWVVRGGDLNELASQVKSKKAVAIGWGLVPDVSHVTDRETLKRVMEETSPEAATPNGVGQLYRFLREITVGDYILTPEKVNSTIHVARCAGDYRYDSNVFGAAYPHVREVEHLKTIPRSLFPQPVRNTLGSLLAVFRADAALPYIRSVLGQTGIVSEVGGENAPEPGLWADEIDGQARFQVLEALDNIEHYDFQVFVAGLLEAMGYRAHPGGKGKDGGVDILAYRDVFGLETPRIKVQVKNQKSAAGIAEVAYLHGVLGSGESGLFICTGGFSKDADGAAFVKAGRVALVNGLQLLDLIIEYYERFPDTARRLLPLRRIYVPERQAL